MGRRAARAEHTLADRALRNALGAGAPDDLRRVFGPDLPDQVTAPGEADVRQALDAKLDSL